MRELEEMAKRLEESGKSDELRAIANSPEGERIGRLLNEDEVGKAVRSGDSAALKDILTKVLSTDDGRKLAEQLGKAMQK